MERGEKVKGHQVWSVSDPSHPQTWLFVSPTGCLFPWAFPAPLPGLGGADDFCVLTLSSSGWPCTCPMQVSMGWHHFKVFFFFFFLILFKYSRFTILCWFLLYRNQKSESVTARQTHLLFHILFQCGLSQGIWGVLKRFFCQAFC